MIKDLDVGLNLFHLPPHFYFSLQFALNPGMTNGNFIHWASCSLPLNEFSQREQWEETKGEWSEVWVLTPWSVCPICGMAMAVTLHLLTGQLSHRFVYLPFTPSFDGKHLVWGKLAQRNTLFLWFHYTLPLKIILLNSLQVILI